MEIKNVLVLENVTDIDDNFRTYLEQYHTLNNVKVINNLSRGNKNPEIVTELAKADTLSICSSFFNTDQFETILKMLLNFKNIKNIEILYLYAKDGNTKFVDFLNDLDNTLKGHIINVLKNAKVSEICGSIYELQDTSTQYFSKFKYTFDVVEIYYNSKYSVFWHVKQPVVPSLNTFLYKNNTDHLDKKIAKLELYIKNLNIKLKEHENIILSLPKKYASDLKELLLEVDAVINHQITLCEEQDFGDSKSLIEEKKRWLKLLSELEVKNNG